jgi:hypothetical protein
MLCTPDVVMCRLMHTTAFPGQGHRKEFPLMQPSLVEPYPEKSVDTNP